MIILLNLLSSYLGPHAHVPCARIGSNYFIGILFYSPQCNSSSPLGQSQVVSQTCSSGIHVPSLHCTEGAKQAVEQENTWLCMVKQFAAKQIRNESLRQPVGSSAPSGQSCVVSQTWSLRTQVPSMQITDPGSVHSYLQQENEER